MNGVWEGVCEKEGVMMLKAGNLGNHEEARRMKVGGHNIMSFPRNGQVNICWKMEAKSSNSGSCGSVG
jgi:hypothetical protein